MFIHNFFFFYNRDLKLIIVCVILCIQITLKFKKIFYFTSREYEQCAILNAVFKIMVNIDLGRYMKLIC